MHRNEVANREAKAERLAAVLVSDPSVAAHPDLLHAGADFRAQAAVVARTTAPSDRTWDRAVELAKIELRRRGEAALRYVDNEAFIPAPAQGYTAETVAVPPRAPRSSGGRYDSCDHLMGLPCGQRGRR